MSYRTKAIGIKFLSLLLGAIPGCVEMQSLKRYFF